MNATFYTHPNTKRRARIRETLIPGSFVAELECLFGFGWSNAAIDLREPSHRWWPHNSVYADCVGTFDQCVRALGMRGY